jgi:hypothetical protein
MNDDPHSQGSYFYLWTDFLILDMKRQKVKFLVSVKSLSSSKAQLKSYPASSANLPCWLSNASTPIGLVSTVQKTQSDKTTAE